jgi:hypothetical protein
VSHFGFGLIVLVRAQSLGSIAEPRLDLRVPVRIPVVSQSLGSDPSSVSKFGFGLDLTISVRSHSTGSSSKFGFDRRAPA